jgi:hypothetical protein
MSTAAGIAKALKGVRAVSGGYLCSCPLPNHGRRRGDRNPSLWVRDGDFQQLVIHCFAGCDSRDVKDVLRHRGLIDDPARTLDRPARQNGSASGLASRHIVATYSYEDEAGQELFQVVRYEPKDFRQRRRDNEGLWLWSLEGVRRVPYRLPELIEAIANEHTVVIVEGEKDVEALRAINIPATCNPGGASQWRDEYSAHFKGADVVIIPDNDSPGRKHAECVATSLCKVASRLRLLELPGLLPGGDVSDWLGAGGTPEGLWSLIKTAEVWSPPPPKVEPWREGIITAHDLCSMKFDPLKIVVPGLIPEGLTILAGRPKIGKSWFLLQCCSAVATGAAVFGSATDAASPGDVLFLALEDSRRRLQRRLTKHLGSRELVAETSY